jgi:hypothetical protein
LRYEYALNKKRKQGGAFIRWFVYGAITRNMVDNLCNEKALMYAAVRPSRERLKKLDTISIVSTAKGIL